MRITFAILLSFLCQLSQGQYSTTETFTFGDISTEFDDYVSSCNSSMDVTLPFLPGVFTVEVVGVDISYDMTAVFAGSGFMSDQRSQVYCYTTTTLEDNLYSGTGNAAGTMNYNRMNVDIANGSYNTGDVITFDLRAWREWEGNPGCNILEQKIDDGTWTITVHFNGCPDAGGSSVLSTQAEVDQFVADYGFCGHLPNDLTIRGTVTDLSGLSNITSIGGRLEIYDTDLLTSLNGLQGLQSIGLDLSLYNNDLLTDFTGLNNLVSVNHNVNISDNSSLVNLNGLNNLSNIGTSLNISNHSSSFTSLSGLNSLSNMVGDISITSNSGLINCSGLNSLTTLQGSLTLIGNGNMVDLTGLNSLSEIDDLFIQYNLNLTSLTGLNFLTELDSVLFIGYNSLLSDLSALTGLNTFPEIVYIVDNDSVLNLDWLSGISSVSNLTITDNDMLSNITGLTGLSIVDLFLLIENNIGLANLQGLENIASIQDLTISQTPLLTDLSYLENMTITNSFVINDNAGLSDLSGSTGLILDGSIEISNNSNLLNLSGFMEDVQSIEGDLTIDSNNSLTDISQLSNLYILSGDLNLRDNTLLTECCLIDLMYPKVFGSYNISGNNTGCETMLDIQVNCENTDPDNDGISTTSDNCPLIYNPEQEDIDSDGIGNPCDNCSLISNSGQEDANNNFIGDACELAEPGKAGVNTTTPHSGLEISASELYLSDTSRGLIMTNASGSCFRLFIDLNGNLQTKAIDCPN